MAEAQNTPVEMPKTLDERIEILFKNIPIGLCTADINGDIRQINEVARAILGYADLDQNINLLDLVPVQEEKQKFFEILRDMKQSRDFEMTIRRPDGLQAVIVLNLDPIGTADKSAMLVSINDITRIKAIQDELREAKEQYYQLFKSVPIGITVTSAAGKVISFNQALLELTGYTSEDLQSINAAEFYVEKADRLKLMKIIKSVGFARDFETRLIRKDGQIITVLINTDLFDLPDHGRVLLNSLRNISMLKKIEEVVIRERDFSNAILDIATSLILVIDREGRITRFNRACEKTSGYAAYEIIGKFVWEVLSVNSELSRQITEKVKNGGGNLVTHENVWLAKNGDRRLISWSSTSLSDKDGSVEFIIATGIDITRHRQAELDLQASNLKLANSVIKLEENSRHMRLLSDLGDQLQSCQNIEEACSISVQYIRLLFPNSHGALYLINPSKDLAEAIETWGDAVTKIFQPVSCWAIRRSRLHLIDQTHPGLRCGHVNSQSDSPYLCMPMMAQGEILGILHLSNQPLTAQEQDPAIDTFDDNSKILMELSEHISLAISNLKLRDALRQQSIRDVLTGLFNRRYMEETLTRELRRAERENKPVGIIMFDIDHFKEFNDLSGHDGGDALLRELGGYLNRFVRDSDIICRFGGEEFVAVLPGASLENACIRAEELRLGVKNLLIYYLGKPLGKCTISLGVAAYPNNGTSCETILKSADSALYRAKREGRDRVVASEVEQ